MLRVTSWLLVKIRCADFNLPIAAVRRVKTQPQIQGTATPIVYSPVQNLNA